MPLDEIEKTVDKVASPERITRWIVRIVLLIVLISVGVTVTKLALHMNSKVDAVTIDRDWFLEQREVIAGSDVEVRLAQDALARHQAEVAERSGLLSISREEDRVESRRLNQAILDAQKRRIALVEDYNSRASRLADNSIISGLPIHIDLNEVGSDSQ